MFLLHVWLWLPFLLLLLLLLAFPIGILEERIVYNLPARGLEEI